MKTKPQHIYIAGPLTQGDREANVQEAIKIASILLDEGYTPFVPHLTDQWDRAYPRDYEEWMQYDFAWLRRCDAVLRLDGYSPGAEREVELARRLGLPIFFSLAELFAYSAN